MCIRDRKGNLQAFFITAFPAVMNLLPSSWAFIMRQGLGSLYQSMIEPVSYTHLCYNLVPHAFLGDAISYVGNDRYRIKVKKYLSFLYPVSYTHLVKKHQGRSCHLTDTQIPECRNHEGKGQMTLHKGHCRQGRTHGPVSYTHLDVYKRQLPE